MKQGPLQYGTLSTSHFTVNCGYSCQAIKPLLSKNNSTTKYFLWVSGTAASRSTVQSRQHSSLQTGETLHYSPIIVILVLVTDCCLSVFICVNQDDLVGHLVQTLVPRTPAVFGATLATLLVLMSLRHLLIRAAGHRTTWLNPRPRMWHCKIATLQCYISWIKPLIFDAHM